MSFFIYFKDFDLIQSQRDCASINNWIKKLFTVKLLISIEILHEIITQKVLNHLNKRIFKKIINPLVVLTCSPPQGNNNNHY